MATFVAPPLPYLLAAPAVALVVWLRFRRMMRGQRLRIEWMWVRPAIVVIAAALVVFLSSPPTGNDWIWMAVAFLPGVALGWYRGSMVQVTIDPATHELTSKASAAAMLFVVTLIAVRLGLRYVAFTESEAWNLDPVLVTDVSLAFFVGLVCVQRVEMTIRARRLLLAARANSAVAEPGLPS